MIITCTNSRQLKWADLRSNLHFCLSRLLLNLLSYNLMTPPIPLARRPTPESNKWTFFTPLNSDSTAYRNLAMELIFLCRFLVQAHKQTLNYSIQLKLKK
jgi:hypothetical protein